MGGFYLKLGILVAIDEEIELLIDKLEEPEVHKIAGQAFYDGKLFGIPVTLVRAGIGKVSASIATALLIERFNAEAVINTGSAGGLQDGLTIGDVVVATELAYNDTDNRIFDYEFGQVPEMPAKFISDKGLNDMIFEAAEEEGRDVLRGLIVTGDSFVSSQEQIKTIKTHFPDVVVTEMEGSAVAQTCYQFGVPFTVIRAVSDVGDEGASEDFDKFIDLAGRLSAELVLTFVEKYAKDLITDIIKKYSE